MISMIPQDKIPAIWPRVEGYVEEAVKLYEGRYEAVDIFLDMMSGQAMGWIAFNEDKDIEAFWTTRVIEYPRMKVLLIDSLGGKNMEAWEEDAIALMDRYANDIGCEKIEARGRKGWERVGKKYGYTSPAVVMEKNIGA